MDDDDPNQARVHVCQELLFPQSARELSDKIGLNWWATIKLHEGGWLSFDPESTNALNERQEHELRFVGSLVIGGCTSQLMEELLDGLERPYCYDGRRIYYDWAERRWRLLPQPVTDPETVFAEWLEALKDEGDVARLEEIQSQVEAALNSLSRTEE
jgi:hypothetical protein